MTAAADRRPPDRRPSDRPSRRRRLVVGLVAGALAAAGLGVGLAVSAGGARSSPAASGRLSFGAYRSVMARYGPGSMMDGGSGGWIMGRSGYTWMMGGTAAPGWMRGRNLPGMMGSLGADPGTIMGRLFAGAPGPRVSRAAASRLGDAVPAGATVDRAARRLTFSSSRVRLVVLASPSMPSENFRIAGMTDPTVMVPEGARLSVELVNADADMAHGFVVTADRHAARSGMPMLTAPPAFDGSALWFLGESAPAGLHVGTVAFTATRPGRYEYLCPVPDHAKEGMAGALIVAGKG